MKIVLATHNPNKAREMRQILDGLPAGSAAPPGLEFITLADFEGAPEVEEDGKTLEENAVKKARSALSFTGLPALADDTGLEVDALSGAPGVFAARYAGPGCSYADNNKKLLEALYGLSAEKRSARFRCVMALAHPGGKIFTTEGRLEGFITDRPRGGSGFGYDPVFEVKGLGKTLAELSAPEKNAISHRSAALRGIINAIIFP